MAWNPEHSEYRDVMTRLVKAGFNHIDAIIKIAQDPSVKPETQLKALEALLSRTSPALKTITQEIGEDLKVEFKRLKDEMHAICDRYRSDY